jgi:hypothetical protein
VQLPVVPHMPEQQPKLVTVEPSVLLHGTAPKPGKFAHSEPLVGHVFPLRIQLYCVEHMNPPDGQLPTLTKAQIP